jgi:hypothetical protein
MFVRNAECIMSQQAFRSLSRKGWRLTRVKVSKANERIDGYELILQSGALFWRKECRVAVWRGKINILCCNSQYIAEFADTAFDGYGFDGGLIRVMNVLLPDASRANLEFIFRYRYSDEETAALLTKALHFFDILNHPNPP